MILVADRRVKKRQVPPVQRCIPHAGRRHEAFSLKSLFQLVSGKLPVRRIGHVFSQAVPKLNIGSIKFFHAFGMSLVKSGITILEIK